jgi:GxxExxY protein
VSDVIDLNVSENKITAEVMDCFLKVHRIMGPGLLESIYEECLSIEFSKRNISFSRQNIIPLKYEDVTLSNHLKLDLLVENKIIIELKSVESILPIHEAQILSYLKLSGIQVGFLVNFNVPLIKQGVKRYVNNLSFSATSAPPR